MTGQQRTYPEFKPRLWALAMPWTLTQIEVELRRGLTGHPESPRHRAYTDTLAAVHELAHRGVTEFRGDKVQKLLIKAAQAHGWRAPKQGTKRPLPRTTKPDHRVCAKCYEEKHDSLFRALATPAQKRRNGWSETAQHYTVHKLCAPCRVSNARRAKRKAGKQEAPTLVGAYRRSIAMSLETVAKVFKKHTAYTDPDTGQRAFNFSCDEDGDYYVKREALLREARKRLDSYIEDGTLLAHVPDPPQGLWFELLTQEQRDTLARMHRAGSWMQPDYRSRIPLLWEKSPHKNAADAAPMTQIKSDRPSPASAPAPAHDATVIKDDGWADL